MQKQGQITANIENQYVLKLINSVAKCSKITNTLLFINRIWHDFSAICSFLKVMSECPKVHFVALPFICLSYCKQVSHKIIYYSPVAKHGFGL